MFDRLSNCCTARTDLHRYVINKQTSDTLTELQITEQKNVSHTSYIIPSDSTYVPYG